MIQLIKKKRNWIVFAILFSISIVLFRDYFFLVDRPNLEGRIRFHNQIIDKNAPCPYRYRILVPFLIESIIEPLEDFMPHRKAFLISYGLYEVIAIFFLLFTLFIYLRNWFSKEESLIATLFVGGTMSIALKHHYFQPWSLLEVVFFTLGLLAIFKKRYVLFGTLIFFATLNRETGVFLPLAYLFTNIEIKKKAPLCRKSLFLFLIYLLLWLVVFSGLRWFLGAAGHRHIISELWAVNTENQNLLRTFINGFLFLGFFWVFALLGFKYAPKYIRKTARVIPFYLLVIILYGVWYEVRLLMPLYPILVPLGLSFIYRNQRQWKENSG